LVPVQLLPFLLVPGTRAIVTAVVVGGAAAAMTYGFGRVFGTVAG
jgi:VIT1/CCC1 family predicted Fe2+/Mn2+ transporter